jgi:TatD DNase family protein
MTALVDFHCHPDLFPDPVAAISKAEHARVYTLTVTTTPKAWPRNKELTANTRHVRAALGLHPQLVSERAAEIDLWERHLPETRYVGEVGIDLRPKYYKSLQTQRQIFERILQRCAEVGGKILTVHSVRATKLVLDLIEANLPPTRGQVVLHWFSGSKSEARRAAELNCYFSINAAMMTTDKGRSLVASIPSDRVLTETDAPFTNVQARPSQPADVIVAIERLADLHGQTPIKMTEIVEQNLRALLGHSNHVNVDRPLDHSV